MTKLRPTHPTILEAAKRWALANRSDPFALAIALAHARNGISSMSNDQGKAAYYDAMPGVEMRAVRGVDGRRVEFSARVWMDLVRP